MKKFNITGLCIPEKHYMVDTSGRINKIINMIDNEEYFTINQPRQYGKTTTLNLLYRELSKKYFVIISSFEGEGDVLFGSEEAFCGAIFEKFADNIKMVDEELSDKLRKRQIEISNFRTLSNGITNLIKDSGKDIILLIDEIDKNSNSKVFLQFLGLLRSKYLERAAGRDITFKSVILAGVHDVKNLKLTIHDENDVRFNSPWNIASRFNVDMSFTTSEIEVMLSSYKKDLLEDSELCSEALNPDFDINKIAKEIYRLTNGYPYLVSDICYIIDQMLKRDWTIAGVENAVKEILTEKNTLFDDVIKNIQNNNHIETVIKSMLFEGVEHTYSTDAYETGILYGIFKKKDSKLAIHNIMFELRIYNYLIEQEKFKRDKMSISPDNQNQFIQSGHLNMELLLIKFQEFMSKEYRHQDEQFYEANGRLLFLAYIIPVINGRGFYFIEPETREKKRMDVVITYADKKYIVELKIWRGLGYEKEGLAQLTDYLDIQKESEGYLLTFGFGKVQKSEWIKLNDKKVFNIVV